MDTVGKERVGGSEKGALICIHVTTWKTESSWEVVCNAGRSTWCSVTT